MGERREENRREESGSQLLCTHRAQLLCRYRATAAIVAWSKLIQPSNNANFAAVYVFYIETLSDAPLLFQFVFSCVYIYDG